MLVASGPFPLILCRDKIEFWKQEEMDLRSSTKVLTYVTNLLDVPAVRLLTP